MTVDKLLVDYIIGDLEFDGLYTYLFYHVYKSTPLYDLQLCHGLYSSIQYAKPLSYYTCNIPTASNFSES